MFTLFFWNAKYHHKYSTTDMFKNKNPRRDHHCGYNGDVNSILLICLNNLHFRLVFDMMYTASDDVSSRKFEPSSG